MNANTDFGTFGRFAETPVSEMPEDMRQARDCTLKLRGSVPGPHLSTPQPPGPGPPIGSGHDVIGTSC